MNLILDFLRSNIFIAAFIGSFGTLIIQLILKKLEKNSYSKQVKNILLESSRRVSVYLEALYNEDKQGFFYNLHPRLKGIEIILDLLREMPLNTIPSKDIFVVFRLREIINEIIVDLNVINNNEIELKRVILQCEIFSKDKTINDLRERYEKDLDVHYENIKNAINEYTNILTTLQSEYNLIKKEINKLNK